jgi:hypothetical protein
MNEKIELLRMGARKIASEKDFMSFVLNRYQEMEQISETELIAVLNCSLENFYRLALCKAPDATANDFVQRLEKISEYSQTPKEELNRIIKRVDTLSKLQMAEFQHSVLMAARDKDSTKDRLSE